MKFIFTFVLLSTSLFADVVFKGEYPKGPDSSLTPGKLCDRPDAYRYPERIAYCNRDVDSMLKDDVFREYRNEGYRLTPKQRDHYKIDHLIPLCAGGSNDEKNLWPQHESIYAITDPMESLGCEKLKLARIKQAELVKIILAAKRDLSLVGKTISYLKKL